jgi:hypothetical protein
MNLDSVQKSIKVVLSEGKTMAECDIVASYTDNGPGMVLNASNDTTTNGATPVTAIAPPPQNVERTVTEVLVFNADSVNHTAAIVLAIGAANRVMQEGVIQPGETLIYSTPPRSGP